MRSHEFFAGTCRTCSSRHGVCGPCPVRATLRFYRNEWYDSDGEWPVLGCGLWQERD